MTRRFGLSLRRTGLTEDNSVWPLADNQVLMRPLRATLFSAQLSVEDPINGDLLQAWVEQHLVPTFAPE